MRTMPIRSRSHALEEQSVRRFGDALPSGWAYRKKDPDYGIDGEVEIFNPDGSSTGLSFNVQLRATDDADRADSVRLEVDELDYYRSLDVPTAVVRYGSPDESIFWQWASNIRSRVEIAEGQKTTSYRFSEAERWTEDTPSVIRRSLEVRRRLSSFPPSAAMPLRVDLAAIPSADRYSVDRAISRVIADSRGALVRAGEAIGPVEVLARLEPSFLSIEIDSLGGATFDLKDPTPDDYVVSILYGLTFTFRRRGLHRQAEALALLLTERELAHHNQELAFEACLALIHDLSSLVRLAIGNGLHHSGPLHPLISLAIIRAPQSPDIRQAAMEHFFRASLEAARESGPAGEAAIHYSIGNFYRSQHEVARAAHHYNRARHLRPAYLQTGYFLSELAGVLFLAGHYTLSQRFYREAAHLAPEDPYLPFLLGDALMLSGAIAEARSNFEAALARCTLPSLLSEAELKIMMCDHLIASSGGDTVPRRRSRINLKGDGSENAEHLEFLLRDIDALHPLARFNLGIIRAHEGDRLNALHHFLVCAFIQPQDIGAWANAALCALGLRDEVLLLRIMSTAIHHMGADAYDHFRDQVAAQGMPPNVLALFDEMAMEFLGENERLGPGGFTVRMLDGDGYHTMAVFESGEA
jgi:tetratricopeptide (TPR) repeat protein